MSVENEGAKWREFLKPIVAGAVVLMSVATAYFQQQNSTSADARITAVEIENKYLRDKSERIDASVEVMKEALSMIRSDVSYIRGNMEASKMKK